MKRRLAATAAALFFFVPLAAGAQIIPGTELTGYLDQSLSSNHVYAGQTFTLRNVSSSNNNITGATIYGHVASFQKAGQGTPGKISFASFGTGSTSHVAGELFKMMTGTDMVHVPYRGSAPMIADLLAGQVQVGIDVMPTGLPHIRSGALMALAVAGKKRFSGLPDVPTIGETVAGYEANSWCGVGVPKGTPQDIIERLNREINAGLADPAVKTRLANVATIPVFFTPAEFGDYVAAEIEKWGNVIKTVGVKPE